MPRITRLETGFYRIPLPTVLTDSMHGEMRAFELNTIRVRDSDGAEGVGWELFAIAAVVVGGTLPTGGVGSVGSTLAGGLPPGLIFNILNFENGPGWISLSAYWQSVIRGAFLLLVVAIQARLSMRQEETA